MAAEEKDKQEKELEEQDMTQQEAETPREETSGEPSAGEEEKTAKSDRKEKKKKDKKQDALKEKVEELEDRVKRQMAEFDNFRKRTAKEKAAMYDDGVRDTVEKLLGVVDNLERAVMAQEGKADENDAFFKGVAMTLKQFQEILHSMGVEEIQALGEKFDPNLHAAVAHEDDENYGENEIILEMLKGYLYKERVIRHSMVKVAN